jgi:hypothetical protein
VLFCRVLFLSFINGFLIPDSPAFNALNKRGAKRYKKEALEKISFYVK